VLRNLGAIDSTGDTGNMGDTGSARENICDKDIDTCAFSYNIKVYYLKVQITQRCSGRQVIDGSAADG